MVVLNRDDVIERVESGEEKVREEGERLRTQDGEETEAPSLERLGGTGWLSESSSSPQPHRGA